MIGYQGHMLFLFGPPGAGKSTITEQLLKSALPIEDQIGAAWVTWWRAAGGEPVCEFGRPDNGTGFRGSDRLTMNAITYLKPWVEAMSGPELVLVEGDRFADEKFLRWASEHWKVWLVYVHASPEVLEVRRAKRQAEKGANWKFKTRKTTGAPNASWLKGRESKVRKLLDQHPEATVLVEGYTPEEYRMALIRTGCPVVSALTGGSNGVDHAEISGARQRGSGPGSPDGSERREGGDVLSGDQLAGEELRQ